MLHEIHLMHDAIDHEGSPIFTVRFTDDRANDAFIEVIRDDSAIEAHAEDNQTAESNLILRELSVAIVRLYADSLDYERARNGLDGDEMTIATLLTW